MTADGTETPVRVVSTCGTQARFVALFCRYFDGDRMWILTGEAKAQGEALSVDLKLSDGSTVLAFSGKVLESSTANGTPYGRPGMLVQITSVPPASRGVMHLLHMASAEWGRATRVAVGDVPTEADLDATATITMEIDPSEAPDPNAPGYSALPPPLPPVPPAGDPDDAPTQAVTDVIDELPPAFPDPLTARGKRFREATTAETRVEGRRALQPRTAEELALEAETQQLNRSRPDLRGGAPVTDSIASLLEPTPPPVATPPGAYWQPAPDARPTHNLPPLRYPFLQRSLRMPVVLAIAGAVFLLAFLLGLAVG